MKFSILICSLQKRKCLLRRLINILDPQIDKYKSDIEILTDIDNGKLSIGQKRNKLIKKASGKYIAFIDDDDLVFSNYIDKIMIALESNKDCCGLEGIITTNGRDPRVFIHSIKYNRWFTKRRIYYRSPNHLNPVKRQIALKIKFPHINKGEDRNFSRNIRPLLRTEEYIKGPIYKYLYIKRKKF